jgi:hypothetical protein
MSRVKLGRKNPNIKDITVNKLVGNIVFILLKAAD